MSCLLPLNDCGFRYLFSVFAPAAWPLCRPGSPKAADHANDPGIAGEVQTGLYGIFPLIVKGLGKSLGRRWD
jgi:hypothetical protein